MLSLHQFHLQLRRVQPDDLEEIRQGRNTDSVRKNHIYQQLITPDMQNDWFVRTLKPENYYFVIVKRGKKIGLVHVSNIREDLSCADYGLFLWDAAYRGSRVPLLTTLLILDFFFVQVQVTMLTGKVLKSNAAIQRICRFFHFDLTGNPGDEFLTTSSTLQNYLSHRQEFLSFARRCVHDDNECRLTIRGDASTPHLPAVSRLL
ncbi:MAG: GNAT family N-acetyltransferase [Turneriella sp.]